VIHPTAIIHPEAQVAETVRVGPYAVIGAQARLADFCVVGPHVVIEGETTIGEGCMIYPNAVLGTPPQDVKYAGEPTRLEIGARCTIREGVTFHRGTVHGGGVTRVGDDGYFMANSHVGHDAQVGGGVIMANSAALAGHVTVGDGVGFGGLAGVHQFARIGTLAFIGAGAMVRRDVCPFVVAKGDRAVQTNINRVGLERRGFAPDRIRRIEEAYGYVVRIGVERGLEKLLALPDPDGDLAVIAAFIRASKLGLSPFRE